MEDRPGSRGTSRQSSLETLATSYVPFNAIVDESHAPSTFSNQKQKFCRARSAQ
jgi:hypothetical protein